MKKYLTPDFDVTVYEITDKITADVSFVSNEPEDDDFIWG